MERVWHGHYDAGVPKEIEYPQIPADRLLKNAARDYPKREALWFGAMAGGRLMEAALCYWEPDALTDSFAKGLEAMGVRKGDRVAVMLPNCPQFVIAAHAVWRLGAVRAGVPNT